MTLAFSTSCYHAKTVLVSESTAAGPSAAPENSGVRNEADHPPLDSANTLRLRLTVRGGDEDGREIQIDSPRTLFGSHERCAVRFREPGIRPFHCEVIRDPVGFLVKGCTLETSLNGRPVTSARLQAGDRLQLAGLEVEVGNIEFHSASADSNATEQGAEVAPEGADADTGLPRTQVAQLTDRSNPFRRAFHAACQVARRNVTESPLARELAEARDGLAVAERLRSEAEADRDALSTAVGQIQSQLNDLQAYAGELSRELDQIRQERELLRRHAESERKELDAARAAIQECRQTITALQREAADTQVQLQTQNTNLRAELELAEEAKRILEAQVLTQTQQLQELHDALHRLQVETAQAQTAWDAERDGLRRELETAREAERRLASCEKELAARHEELADRQRELTTRQAELADRQADLVAAEMRQREVEALLARERAERTQERDTLVAQLVAARDLLREFSEPPAVRECNAPPAASPSADPFGSRCDDEPGLPQPTPESLDDLSPDEILNSLFPRAEESADPFSAPVPSSAYHGGSLPRPEEFPSEIPAEDHSESVPQLTSWNAERLANWDDAGEEASEVPVDTERFTTGESTTTHERGPAERVPDSVTQSTTDEEDDESIRQYMDRLLNRIRSEKDVEPEAAPRPVAALHPKPVVAKPAPTAISDAADGEGELQGDVLPRSRAPEVCADLAAMRELANASASSAIAKSRQQRRTQSFRGKIAASLIMLSTSIALMQLASDDRRMFWFGVVLSCLSAAPVLFQFFSGTLKSAAPAKS